MAGSSSQFEPSILLVEDDTMTREQLGELLIRHFRDLDFAENGEQGLKRYEERKHDIVVTDIQMPVMDGMDMACRIRKLNAGVQIVFMTAYTDLAGSAYMHQVAVNYVQKPIDVDELVKVLNECRKIIAEEKGIVSDRG